jgi:hypothetical protein
VPLASASNTNSVDHTALIGRGHYTDVSDAPMDELGSSRKWHDLGMRTDQDIDLIVLNGFNP